MNLVKLGRIALDGTKVKANASKHKQVMGLRQFSMRGLEKVAGEWTLAALAWNVKRMNVLKMTA